MEFLIDELVMFLYLADFPCRRLECTEAAKIRKRSGRPVPGRWFEGCGFSSWRSTSSTRKPLVDLVAKEIWRSSDTFPDAIDQMFSQESDLPPPETKFQNIKSLPPQNHTVCPFFFHLPVFFPQKLTNYMKLLGFHFFSLADLGKSNEAGSQEIKMFRYVYRCFFCCFLKFRWSNFVILVVFLGIFWLFVWIEI